MNELDKRLDKIEQQLNIISSSQSPVFGNPISSRSDEIDLRELFAILWQGKWWIIGITFLFAVAGVIYAKSLPDMYKSQGIYAPAQKQSGGGLGGQLGGLASLAGVSIGGGESNDVEQAIALMNSWPFLEKVINEYDLKPLLMGVKGWNRDTGKFEWNKEIYDPVAKKWLREPPPGREAEPSSYEAYRVFKEMLEVKYDLKAGMVTLSVEHFSPEVAQQWVGILVSAVNEHFQLRDMSKAKKSIAYLQQKISETGIAEMQAVFYGMIEAQTKTLMLAEVDSRYLLVDVVHPKVAELRSSPRRPLIVFLFTFLGGMLTVVLVLVRGLFKNSKVG